jgi:hypothetical protein
MKFDYSFIPFFGYPMFEPMVMLTNSVLFILSIIFFSLLKKYTHPYSIFMRRFILLVGVSAMFGGIGHAVHYQLGTHFFNAVLFLMNATSFFSIYYCFLAAFSYTGRQKGRKNLIMYSVLAWVMVVLFICFVNGTFLLIKIHAALVLIYAVIVHIWAAFKRPESGNKAVIAGMLISFLPILVHTQEITLHYWFNYKDLSHVIMIISLAVIYRGVLKNSRELEKHPQA